MPEKQHVYVVESYQGEYSDYCHNTEGVFSSYEKAVKWIEGHAIDIPKEGGPDTFESKLIYVRSPFSNGGDYWMTRETVHPQKRIYEDEAIWEYPSDHVGDYPSYTIAEMEVQ